MSSRRRVRVITAVDKGASVLGYLSVSQSINQVSLTVLYSRLVLSFNLNTASTTHDPASQEACAARHSFRSTLANQHLTHYLLPRKPL